ncbi:MAG: hypothetical protein IJR53_06605 [Bacteroidales bacterium]|nr:hypothetical protein [Bacteroidales bacterium]
MNQPNLLSCSHEKAATRESQSVATMGVTTWWPEHLGKSAPIDPAARRHHHPGPTAEDSRRRGRHDPTAYHSR